MNYTNNPYINPYINTQMSYNNPYIQQPVQQRVAQPIQQPIQPTIPIGLQGKSVDSIEVVKAMDIPLDGTISYFPLTDGTAIVTKQLQMDGTSKTIVYTPVEAAEVKDVPSYVTTEQLEEKIKEINNNTLKDDIKALKRNVEDLKDDIDKIKSKKEK